jgi:hypothetical protein
MTETPLAHSCCVINRMMSLTKDSLGNVDDIKSCVYIFVGDEYLDTFFSLHFSLNIQPL